MDRDYLFVNPIIEDQQYACVSFLSPEPNKLNNRLVNIRGVLPTLEKATAYAKYTFDGEISVYVIQVGYWIPCFTQIDVSSKLNTLMYDTIMNFVKEKREFKKMIPTNCTMPQRNKTESTVNVYSEGKCCCLSFLTSETIFGMKLHGIFNSEADAHKYVKNLSLRQRILPTFIAPCCSWVKWDPKIEDRTETVVKYDSDFLQNMFSKQKKSTAAKEEFMKILEDDDFFREFEEKL